jgi:hypothetical protein
MVRHDPACARALEIFFLVITTLVAEAGGVRRLDGRGPGVDPRTADLVRPDHAEREEEDRRDDQRYDEGAEAAETV